MGPRRRHTKYIFVTGGVVSSIGKGISAACIAALMESRGLKVTLLKLDPYLNVDPGTMNPFQHGEVFVTDDGAETDLDLGHYERFTGATMTRQNNVTSGQVYAHVLEQERRGDFLGGTVQVIPHITDEIRRRIQLASEHTDLCIVEVGGTVGDIESQPFLETVRQIRLEMGREHVACVHVTYVPYIRTAGELKTKPTQHSVMALRTIGIQPDLLVCRSERPMPPEVKRKISLFCNVPPENVIAAEDADSVYEIPLRFHQEGLDQRLVDQMNIWSRDADLSPWLRLQERMKTPGPDVIIAIIGKYVDLQESYKSLNEALFHGGLAAGCRVRLHFLEAEDLEKSGDPAALLAGMHGVLVPGGFGRRGVEGKIRGIHVARTQGIPFLGICLGLQLATIEFARNVCGLQGANSTEFDPDTPHPVVNFLPGQQEQDRKGATMRLGSYECEIEEGSLAQRIYRSRVIHERHRHRYEVINSRIGALLDRGFRVSGIHRGPLSEASEPLPDGRRGLVEIIEIPDHPFFVACQFHPEYRSRPLSPHPLFAEFVRAAMQRATGVPAPAMEET